MYQVHRPSSSAFVPIRNLNYHVRTWGMPSASTPPLVLVHGWMDVAASFQFVVDAFSEAFVQDRFVIAPDWRGYGLTSGGGVDNYWLPDYMADLDFLLDHYAPERPVDLLGHSLGGNVVMMYAGVRPERIRKLINLEGFGMPETKPSQAPSRYAKWMDELKKYQRGELAMRAYESISGVARRLMKTNPRLSQDKADWLAQHWSAPDAQGQHAILGDPAHKIVNANLSRHEETLACYARITAPLLAVQASSCEMDNWYQGRYTLAQYHERLKTVPNYEIAQIEDAGHMLHHDQPAQLADLIERFIGA